MPISDCREAKGKAEFSFPENASGHQKNQDYIVLNSALDQ